MTAEKRGAAEMAFDDSGSLHETFTNHWFVLCDKQYVGSQKEISVICFEKEPINEWRAANDKLRIQRNSHDLVSVENIFGRQCSIGLFSQKWRWSNERCVNYV